MSKSYPIIERDHGRVVVLARSAEEAHLAATDELGVSCVIESVERVRSGGLGGFFATELIRLVAAAPTPRPAESPGATPSSFARAEDLVRSLPSGTDFADRLKEELAQLRAQGAAAADDVLLGRAAPTPDHTSHRPFTLSTSRPTPSAADDALAAIPVRLAPEPAPEPEPEPARERVVLEAEWLEEMEPEAEWTMEALDIPVRFVETEQNREPALASSVAGRNGAEACDARDVLDDLGTNALLAQVVAAEFETEDRPVTHRARLIQTGAMAPTPLVPEVETCEVETCEVETCEVETCEVETCEVETPVDDAASVDVVTSGPAIAVDPELAQPQELVPDGPPATEAHDDPDMDAWSVPMLRAVGLPDLVVDHIAEQSPRGDIEHLVAFMLSVRDLCRPLLDRAMVLTGPSCANLARQFGLTSQSGDVLAASAGSVASPNATPDVLRTAAGGRGIHLVVGGHWHHLARIRPDVVSAATEHDLLEALRVAVAWGASLGWTQAGERYVRIDPYLLAGRVRELLPAGSDSASISPV